MGGRVGLKGTDGCSEGGARALGAQPVVPQRTAEALRSALARLLSHVAPMRWLTCAGIMGEETLRSVGFSEGDIEIVCTTSGEPAAADTRGAIRRFQMRDVALIFFCGGDWNGQRYMQCCRPKSANAGHSVGRINTLVLRRGSSMGALFHASVSYNIVYLILKKYVCNKKNNAFACAGLRVRFSKYLFGLIP